MNPSLIFYMDINFFHTNSVSITFISCKLLSIYLKSKNNLYLDCHYALIQPSLYFVDFLVCYHQRYLLQSTHSSMLSMFHHTVSSLDLEAPHKLPKEILFGGELLERDLPFHIDTVKLGFILHLRIIKLKYPGDKFC